VLPTKLNAPIPQPHPSHLLPPTHHPTQAAGPSSPPVGLEFMDPPRSPFLPQYSVGRASPYGEETWALLSSLAAQGGLCCQQYAATYAALLGEGFDGYRNASTTVREQCVWGGGGVPEGKGRRGP
jgi:hypothetical protein